MDWDQESDVRQIKDESRIRVNVFGVNLEAVAFVIRCKNILRILWLALVVLALGFYFFEPQYFKVEYIKAWGKDSESLLMPLFIGVSLVRGVLFLPSTPFVILGTILFGDELGLVWLVSMLGIMFGGALLYFLSNYLRPTDLLNRQQLERFENTSSKLSKYGFWIVLGWSFFPIVPTDLVCVVAGTTKFSFKSFMLGLFIGEALLVSAYVFGINFLI